MIIKTKKDVLQVITSGTLDVRPIFNTSQWTRSEEQFKREGCPLMSRDNLMKSRRADARLLLSDYNVSLHLQGTGIIRYRFKKGYVTDLASVPKKLRSIVDNDDPALIIAALCHDAGYGTQLVEFRTTNRLFYDTIRLQGGSWYLATKAFLPVALSRCVYNKNKARRQEVRQFVNIWAEGETNA